MAGPRVSDQISDLHFISSNIKRHNYLKALP